MHITAEHDGHGDVWVRIVDLMGSNHTCLATPAEAAKLADELTVAVQAARQATERGVCRTCRWREHAGYWCGWAADMHVPEWLPDVRPASDRLATIRNCPAWHRREG